MSRIGDRVRRPWFDRWVRNPARIVPQMEMPSVQQSVRGVLDGKLNHQLAAVWQVLNRRDFTPPSPSALRVVRRANIPDLNERADVVTDLVDVGGRQFVRPLVIGLANRHNVLVDLASNRLAAWWLGDTAREQTRGKSWYWEAGMPQLLAVSKKDAPRLDGELTMLQGDQRIGPISDGEYLGEFDSFEHVPGGIRFSQRLQFRAPQATTTLAVEQTFTALPHEAPAGHSGFRRRVAIGATHADVRAQLLVLAGDVTVDPTGRSATLRSGGSSEPSQRGATLQVVLQSPAGARLFKTAEGGAIRLPLAPKRPPPVSWTTWPTSWPISIAPLPQPDRSVARQDLKVVPGYEAVRLPLTDEAMPTGLAWRGDGTLVVSSLEGRDLAGTRHRRRRLGRSARRPLATSWPRRSAWPFRATRSMPSTSTAWCGSGTTTATGAPIGPKSLPPAGDTHATITTGPWACRATPPETITFRFPVSRMIDPRPERSCAARSSSSLPASPRSTIHAASPSSHWPPACAFHRASRYPRPAICSLPTTRATTLPSTN